MAEEMNASNGLGSDTYEDDEIEENKFLTFRIDTEIYGINVLDVVEILRMVMITNIPEAHEYIKGIINLRGKIIPVMSVRLRFNLEEREYDDRTCIVVVSVNGMEIGLIVDSVAEVLEIPDEQIDSMPSVSQSGHQKFIKGIGKVENQVKILLDLEKMIGEEELSVIKDI